MEKDETKILRKFCGAVLECKDSEPYKSFIKTAEQAVGKGFSDGKSRKTLVTAVEKNLANPRQNPFDMLQRKYSLPISRNDFTREKSEFCHALAAECGILPGGKRTEKRTVDDILDMLYTIADEANGFIVGDGASFNHQVAGVALKAIDQAVKLSGLAAAETETEDARIILDDKADGMAG